MSDEDTIDTNPLHHSEQPAEQPPQSLREIAEREGLTRHKRQHVESGVTPDGDQVLLPDGDGIRWYSDDNEPRFKSADAAATFLEEEREDRKDQVEAEDTRQRREFHENWKNALNKHATLSTPEESQAIDEYRQRYARWEQADAQLRRAAPVVNERVRQLQEGGHNLEAQHLAQNFVANWNASEGERGWLNRRVEQGQQHLAKKTQQAHWLELYRQHPEISDPQFVEAALSWGEREGYSRHDVLAENNRQLLSQFLHTYKKYEQEQYQQLARKRVAAEMRERVTRGSGAETSSAAARNALSEKGKPDSALAFWAAKRLERKFGI